MKVDILKFRSNTTDKQCVYAFMEYRTKNTSAKVVRKAIYPSTVTGLPAQDFSEDSIFTGVDVPAMLASIEATGWYLLKTQQRALHSQKVKNIQETSLQTEEDVLE